MPRWTPGLSTVSRRDDHAAAAASGPAGRSGARVNGPARPQAHADRAQRVKLRRARRGRGGGRIYGRRSA